MVRSHRLRRHLGRHNSPEGARPALLAWDQAVSQGGDVSTLIQRKCCHGSKTGDDTRRHNDADQKHCHPAMGPNQDEERAFLVHLGSHSPTASIWSHSESTLLKREPHERKKMHPIDKKARHRLIFLFHFFCKTVCLCCQCRMQK